MSPAPGTRLGPYEILAPLGAGGMGEVYRARDSKLNRDVALKILPGAFATDPDRLARFRREAQVLASLNHPNIGHIYGFEDSGASHALVLELVEGPTLADRIAQGPIPLADALPIAKQIADALEAAHEQGIIHRDLKPANVKVRADGTVKVLDFGLAKMFDPRSPVSTEVMNSPTITAAARTERGVILGTAAYMAPEQAKGQAVDKRADIWAFGVVLYEMLTGRRPFRGDSVSETLAAVLKEDPDWSCLPADLPAPLRRLLGRCIDREVKRRLRDIGEARVEIARVESGAPDVGSGPTASAAGPPRNWREALAWSVAGAAVLAALGVAYFRPSGAPAAATRAVRLAFVPPDNVAMEDVSLDYAVVSPDGQTLVFTGRTRDGQRQLWVRPLDSMDAHALPDTEDAIEPFWSPDSRSVAFGAHGKLKRVDLAGGRAQTLADAGRLNSGSSWSRTGVILFSPDYGKGLFRVPATGGPVGGELKANAHGACFLPDGRHFIYTEGSLVGGKVAVGSLDSADVTSLPGVAGRTVYAPPGWLLFVRNGALAAQPFNAEHLALSGEPVPVTTGTSNTATFDVELGFKSTTRFSVSDTGVLVLENSQARDYQLVWFDRAGKQVGTVGPVARVTEGQGPRLSPDGTRVVMQRVDSQGRNRDIWVFDRARMAFDRVTAADPAWDQAPVWARPDGRHIFFQADTTTRNNVAGIYQVAASGGDEQLVLKGIAFPSDLSQDGRLLIYEQRGEHTRVDIWALPLSGDRQPYPLLNSEFDEGQSQISPDGRWLVYTSDVTGTGEVYVRRLTPEGKLGDASRISTGGGTQPRWRPDGRELFYTASPQGNADVQMMAVPVQTGGTTLEFGTATALFKTRMLPQGGTGFIGGDYDVTADGQRFLIGTLIGGSKKATVSIVLNWAADLKK